MRLVACLDGKVAGFVSGDGSRASFVYAEEWLRDPGAYPLSFSLPLQAQAFTGRGVLNFLWGLLPDNDRVLDVWSRWFHVSARNPLALLAHVGEDCAGAVQFATDERLEEILASNRRTAQVQWLESAELESRIRQLVKDGAAGRTADEGQFSLAGAQSKMALHWDPKGGRWGVPRGRVPTTHILKPVANQFDGFAENERFCLMLARRVGFSAARTEWQSVGEIPTLIVERYDRIKLAGQWRRIHQEDGCQALGVHPDAKYESDGGPGFVDLMNLLNNTDDPRVDRDRLMAAACFTYLVGATDVHAKNFSMLHAHGGAGPSMRLAPFYDIASAWPYTARLPMQKIKLAMRVGGHYRIREILPRHFRKLALACHYPPEAILKTLSDLAGRLPDEAAGLLNETSMKGMDRSILSKLADGLASQCRAVSRHIASGFVE